MIADDYDDEDKFYVALTYELPDNPKFSHYFDEAKAHATKGRFHSARLLYNVAYEHAICEAEMTVVKQALRLLPIRTGAIGPLGLIGFN